VLLYYICNVFSVRQVLSDLPNVSRFIKNSVAPEWRLRPPLGFPPVCIIQSMLHTHLYLHVALSRRTNGCKLETIHSEIGEHWIKTTFIFIMSI